MKWSQLKQYLKCDDEDCTLEDSGFVSYVIEDGYEAIATGDPCDNSRVTYFQIIAPGKGEVFNTFVFQLERFPEDPFNCVIDMNIDEIDLPIQIFKLIDG